MPTDITLQKAEQKRWALAQADEEKVKYLSGIVGIHEVLARLLILRGVESFDDARLFFRPSLEHLHDPFEMKDMRLAVKRLEKALEREEKILVYGDYDVDGTTAVALVYSFLKDFYPDRIDYYIPDRYVEGYGISVQGIEYAAHNGYSLIIALDCGIRAHDKVAFASSKGIDFIICDHHLPEATLPKAVAVLDPKRFDCFYPYKELSGCGIGFKLIQAFALENSIPNEVVYQYLDLVAVSTACDIVPITGENRVLAHYGLKLLNESPRKGLGYLIERAGVANRKLSISDLVFYIGPRINAAGRMDHGRNAVNLLISDTDEQADLNASNLHNHNDDRKQVDKDITQEALEMIQADAQRLQRKSTVLFQPHWSKGVIGIVASRLIETYYRPTIVLTESNGYLSGSARSVSGFNIHDAIQACSDLLIQFGGHKYAAGLTLPKENYEAFVQKFEEVVAATILPECLVPEISIDSELDICDITPKFYRILKQFAPFGPSNMRPVFITKACRLVGSPRLIGTNHMRITVSQDGKQVCQAIAFGMAHWIEQLLALTEQDTFDICYCLEENEWQGNVSLQMNIKDIRLGQSSSSR
ncbi:MAG: single-stranded-DNA-specific exonuclease RecJ [Chitinophagales bacterium]|nr:single-stranded-DNA-specific exonuclease RecJ [Chitinophagales bacterium]